MLTEKNHAGEFLLSEANGDRSREVIEVASGNTLEAGTILGEITATPGVYGPYDDGAADGRETAKVVLWDKIDTSATGTNADTKALVIARDATVSLNKLYGHDANGEADLAAAGIIVRA